MEPQYVNLYDLLEIFEDIEIKGGPALLAEFKNVLEEATRARYDANSEADVVARYSNDPTNLLWRSGEIKYPDGVYYFNLIERRFVGKEMDASVSVFISINYIKRTITDLSSGIITTN
jgi:hypothetical protein